MWHHNFTLHQLSCCVLRQYTHKTAQSQAWVKNKTTLYICRGFATIHHLRNILDTATRTNSPADCSSRRYLYFDSQNLSSAGGCVSRLLYFLVNELTIQSLTKIFIQNEDWKVRKTAFFRTFGQPKFDVSHGNLISCTYMKTFILYLKSNTC